MDIAMLALEILKNNNGVWIATLKLLQDKQISLHYIFFQQNQE